jgi:hypothetical protein
MLALIRDGLDVDVVARETGISAKTITSWLQVKPNQDHLSPPRIFAVEQASTTVVSRAADPVRFLFGGLEISVVSERP